MPRAEHVAEGAHVVQDVAPLRARAAELAPESNLLSFNNFLDGDEPPAARERDPESTMEGMTPVRPLWPRRPRLFVCPCV